MSDTTASMSMMEKVGLRFFKRLSRQNGPAVAEDEIHVLNQTERSKLLSLQRGAVIRAAIAGGLSAAIGVVIALLLEPAPPTLGQELPFDVQLKYFALVTGITVGVTFLEIAFLYWDALRTVHRISSVAGIDLFPNQAENASVALSLVRAALELPNPPDDIQGVNPRKEVSKFQLIIGTLVYKLKATATNFILKAVVRKMVGRAGFRTLIEFIAVPVYAAWNAVICYWVLRQARIRAMGPSACHEYMGFILKDLQSPSQTEKDLIYQAVGACIVRTIDVHPNIVAMVSVLTHKLGPVREELVWDDSKLFLENLSAADAQTKAIILRVLTVASIIDGSIGQREKGLLLDAYQAAGYHADLSKPKGLLKAFVRGLDIEEKQVQDCLPLPI